jgi:hypothetical protein
MRTLILLVIARLIVPLIPDAGRRRHMRARPLLAARVAAAITVGFTTSAALAQPLEKVHFHDVTSEVLEDFCGDLTVRIDEDIRGSFLLNAHGPDGLAYRSDKVRGTQVITNLANDKTLTQIFSVLEKDLRVTDNGDGTLTILVLATGSSKVYGPYGKLLFSDPGQIRFEILIDHGGTPADPSDEEFLEFLGLVKGSTGHNDLQDRDFCADIHEFIG